MSNRHGGFRCPHTSAIHIESAWSTFDIPSFAASGIVHVTSFVVIFEYAFCVVNLQ